MKQNNILHLEVSSEEFEAIQSSKTQEIYRTATDEWFATLYETDEKTGLANVERPLPYQSVLLDDGQRQLKVTYKNLEVEEFMNQPVDSDERFGFVIVVGGQVG